MNAREVTVAVALLVASDAALGHGGGLDRYGCHNERKTGDYHCHRGGVEDRNTGRSSGQVSVIDGDSLEMRGLRIRLQGIDALESDQTCKRASGERVNTSQSSGQVKVIDGDSLKMASLEIRLQGIDAVEGEQICHHDNGQAWPCGERATQALRAVINRRNVTCVHHGTDGYGRTLGTCAVGGVNLNEWMVRQGWAVAYTRYSNEYMDAQAEAEQAKRNIWSGSFMKPERWRREQN